MSDDVVRFFDKIASFWHALPDPLRRALRTWLQAFLGMMLLQVGAEPIPTAGALADAFVSSSVAAIIAVMSFLHGSLDESRVGPDTR